jgi:hypothetical protein
MTSFLLCQKNCTEKFLALVSEAHDHVWAISALAKEVAGKEGGG